MNLPYLTLQVFFLILFFDFLIQSLKFQMFSSIRKVHQITNYFYSSIQLLPIKALNVDYAFQTFTFVRSIINL